jgi:hypothetical protein
MLCRVRPEFIGSEGDEFVTRGEKIASHRFKSDLFSDLAQPRHCVRHLLGGFFGISALSARHHVTCIAKRQSAAA